jgi:alkanesulfonate monooxygenase SsuD/methylene tetrahydromethanopterin reductase-like flavin-dependent oxidoreductase (luciferase family)
MQSRIKYLYYSPISWPYLKEKLPSFPHTNEAYDSVNGVDLYKATLELFQYAETMGFDWLGVGEEHMNAYGLVPNPCIIAAALAVLTNTSKICVLGNPLPILNPLRVAEEYAMIDVISKGRLIAGFPRGVPQNYLAYGISSENSKQQLYEAVSFVISAWQKKGPFNWEGKHYKFNNVSIWPQPVNLPDLVFSAKSTESILLAIEHKAIIGELYVKNRGVLDHFKNSVKTYKQLAQKDGWEAQRDRFMLSIPCFIAQNDKIAEERAISSITYATKVISGSFEAEKRSLQSSYYKDVTHLQNAPEESLSDRISYGGVLCGGPKTVIEQIGKLLSENDIGILGLQMQVGNSNYDHIRESLYLFGKYIKDNIHD